MPKPTPIASAPPRKAKASKRDPYQDQTEKDEYTEEDTQHPLVEDAGGLCWNSEPAGGDPLNEGSQQAAEQIPDHQDQHDLDHFADGNTAATSSGR